jgi:hypothetical protein
MSINSRWQRWIFASICKHFDDNKGDLPLYIEGQRTTKTNKAFIELRIDGPYYTELSKDYWKVYLEVNALLQNVQDDKNTHTFYTNLGLLSTIFTPIPLFKYGESTDEENDQSMFGCLRIVSDDRGKERIQVNNFGLVDKDARLLQANVEGHYVTHLTGE